MPAWHTNMTDADHEANMQEFREWRKREASRLRNEAQALLVRAEQLEEPRKIIDHRQNNFEFEESDG